MSLAGVINSHTMAALIVLHHGTERAARALPAPLRARRGAGRPLPHRAARRHRRAGDPHGRDAPRATTTSSPGTKMFITNGREGNTFALLALTDPKAAAAAPRHVLLHRREGPSGLPRGRSRSPSSATRASTPPSCSSRSSPCRRRTSSAGVEGRGFKHVMSGLEAGRINIAARAVGVAQAACEDTAGPRARGSAPRRLRRLADMATKVTGGAAADVLGGRDEGSRRAVRPRGGDGEALRLRGGPGGRRRGAADPRRRRQPRRA